MEGDANTFILKKFWKQLGICSYHIPLEIVKKVLLKHGFRKTTEMEDVLIGRPSKFWFYEDLSEKFWISNDEGCLEIEDSIRVLVNLDTRKNSWQLPRENRKEEGLCLVVWLEGINRVTENSFEQTIGEEAKKILEVTIRKGEESKTEILEQIRGDILLQAIGEEVPTKEIIAKTIKKGEKHKTTMGQFRIGGEIETLTFPVKVVVRI